MPRTVFLGTSCPIQGVNTMAVDALVTVGFEDASTAIAERTYMLADTYANDGSDWDTAVTDAAALITQLDFMTMDHIAYHYLAFKIVDSGAAANVAANNNTEAFIRTTLDASGKVAGFSVPAWDDVTFSKAKNGLLSSAFNAYAEAATALIRDPKTGGAWTHQWSQSRGIKRGQRLVK